MKKILDYYGLFKPNSNWHKLLLIMKISAFLLFCCLANIFATPSYSQATKISLNLQDASIEEVLNKIEDVSEFYFLFNQKLIDVTRKVNIEADNEPIGDILNNIFKDDVRFIVYDRQIVLTPRQLPLSASELQQLKISGKVSDEKGNPLAGVNIQVEGTNIGVISDINGKYSINVPDVNAVIMFSFIGYITQKVPATGKTNIDISLLPSLASLDEVVVVGYGTQKKIDLTGSVSSLSSKDYDKQAILDVSSVLQGRSAGVSVTNNSGAPGGFTKIRIRGANSFTGGNDPLYVVDGMQLGGIDNLSINDIESIEVLKDASSTAIYGSRGANGVIMVTTKKGNKEKVKLDFTANLGISRVGYKYNLMGPVAYANLANQANPNTFSAADIAKFQANGGTDWQNEVFRTGKSQDYQLSISGGGQSAKYYISGRVLDQTGIEINSKYKKYNFNANVETEIGKKLKINAGAILSRSEGFNNGNMGGLNQAVQQAIIWGPTEPVFDADGTYHLFDNYGATTGKNPVATLRHAYQLDIQNSVLLNTKISYQILNCLTLDVVTGLTANFPESDAITSIYSPYGGDGSSRSNTSSLWTQNSNILTFHKVLGSIHDLTLTAVYEQSKGYNDNYGVSGGLLFPQTQYYHLSTNTGLTASSNYSASQLVSWVGRFNYSLMNKYLVTATFRADGSSNFPEHNWGYFPSFGIAWRVSEESFIKDLDLFNNLKLRGSYGITGNQAVSPYSTISKMVSETYGYGQPLANVFYYDVANSLADGGLKWESTAQTDFGVDMGVLKNRLTFTFDYFHKKTKDLLMSTPLPLYQAGLTRHDYNYGSLVKNIGAVENKGFEFVIGGVPVDQEDLTWNFNINFSAYKNRITDLGNVKYVDGAPGAGVAGNGASLTRAIVGESLGAFYGYKFLGIYQANEAAEAAKYGYMPGDSKYLDVNSDNKIDEKDEVVIGHALPKYSWGFDNSVRYKNFEFNMFIQAVQGNDVYNLDYKEAVTNYGDHRQITSADVSPWTPTNPSNRWPSLSSTTNNEVSANNNIGCSKWLQDGSYVRLKNLSFGYRLPLLFSKGASLKVMASAQNLLTITKFKGYDPEATTTADDLNAGVVFGAYPSARTFLLTFQLTL